MLAKIWLPRPRDGGSETELRHAIPSRMAHHGRHLRAGPSSRPSSSGREMLHFGRESPRSL